MMREMRQANPLIWLLLLLTAWVLLAAPHVGQKTASGIFYGQESASGGLTLREAAWRLGFSDLAEESAPVPLVGANSSARAATYTGDVYASDFVGPVEWKNFYRGDATLRTNFLSSMAQERGVPATTDFLNSRTSAQFNDIYAEHGVGSQGLPTIGVSDNPSVAQYFARGPNQSQNGFVTTFRVESRDAANFAIPNYENPQSFFEINPNIGLPEREYLFHTQIDPKFIHQQVSVGPK